MILKQKKILTLAALCVMSTACTPTVTQRGNMVEDYQLREVIAGVHTRSDVLRLLGSPTTTAPFDDNLWYYLGQETEKRGILDPEVVEERIVAVAFDETGIVSSVQDVPPDRVNIPIARDKTPTHGTELSITQEFFGNLGRFNKGGAVPE